VGAGRNRWIASDIGVKAQKKPAGRSRNGTGITAIMGPQGTAAACRKRRGGNTCGTAIDLEPLVDALPRVPSRSRAGRANDRLPKRAELINRDLSGCRRAALQDARLRPCLGHKKSRPEGGHSEPRELSDHGYSLRERVFGAGFSPASASSCGGTINA